MSKKTIVVCDHIHDIGTGSAALLTGLGWLSGDSLQRLEHNLSAQIFFRSGRQ